MKILEAWRRRFSRRQGALLILMVTWNVAAETNVIYSTGFEIGEGFSTAGNLIGQAGWDGEGTGGNRVAAGLMPGHGQSAMIGETPPDSIEEPATSVWYSLNLAFIPTNALVRFSVTMEITDSTNLHYDNFVWATRDTNGRRLFGLDFDNAMLRIYAVLQDGRFKDTGWMFTNGHSYRLVILMEFARNCWSATLDGAPLATDEPIVTAGTPDGVGDIDATWFIYNPSFPGDNAMIFDNYQVALEVPSPPQPRLHDVERLSNGWFSFRVSGLPAHEYVVDVLTNLSLHPEGWVPLHTNRTTAEGFFDFADLMSGAPMPHFYRARSLP